MSDPWSSNCNNIRSLIEPYHNGNSLIVLITDTVVLIISVAVAD